ncbi:MAG: diphthine synthase [Thermoplasmata archaeon]|nr:diphthine synthase [Thermoplasmata archaeon]
MGRLIFIGLGLAEGDITLRGLEAAGNAEVLLCEEYTSTVLGDGLGWLERKLDKPIRSLSRKEVEEEDVILSIAKERSVAFLVAGDAMMATTHSEILTRAREEGIEVGVCYGVSIYTAVASALGLMHYKFGRTATLPYPEGDYLPTSPYDVIKENHDRGLHTLVLLDIRAEEKRYMSVAEAIGVLEEMEKKKNGGLVSKDLLLCAGARIGSGEEKVAAGRLEDMKGVDMGPPLHCLVVPGKLHFTEEDALRQIRGGPKA